MEYRGVTYISQVDAADVVAALRKWVENLNFQPIAGFGSKRKIALVEYIQSEIADGLLPTPIEGVTNVWCATGRCRGGFMLIDMIKTSR